MKTLRIVLIVILAAVALYSGYRLIDYGLKVYQADRTDEDMLAYKPAIPSPDSEETGDDPAMSGDQTQETDLFEPIRTMQSINPDFIGWLNIRDTDIDFAFAQSGDNDYYLYKDINREYSISGTVFLDYRCQKDFTSQVSILYGHHMKKAAKFSYLDAFESAGYLREHEDLCILLTDRLIRARVFAYAVVPHNSSAAFNTVNDAATLVSYLREHARVFEDPGFETGDQIILLATCNYEYENARAILAACVKNTAP